MYGKFFASTFSGSMMAAGPEVFAVWGYVIATAVDSTVELNPKLLAAVIGSTPKRMQAAIEALCAPDPSSRSPEAAGRRLVQEGPYQFRVTNHEKYRTIRNEEERREYNRLKKREERARKSNGASLTVRDKSAASAHTEAEAEAEADTETKTEARAPLAAQPSKAGTVCAAMRKIGLIGTNPGDPRLLTLIEQGATESEFVSVAQDAVRGAKGWAWVLTVVAARRQEAAAIRLAPKAPESTAAAETRRLLAEQEAHSARVRAEHEQRQRLRGVA
jgi:hypothetical protein